jgi:hypothetical protein
MFMEKSRKPDDKALSGVLGSSFKTWVEIRDSVRKEHGPAVEEWKYYGAKSGWVLKFLLKKRNLFFMSAQEKYFRLAFIFGDKAVDAIAESDIPSALIREVKEARRYAEGRGLRLEIRNRSSMKDVLTLVNIKVHS